MKPTEIIWLVNATEEYSALPVVCQQARAAGQVIQVIHRQPDREAIRKVVSPGNGHVGFIELPDGSRELPGSCHPRDAEVFFLPCSGRIDWMDLAARAPLEHADCIQALFAMPPRVHSRLNLRGPAGWFGWRAGADLARRILCEPDAWGGNGIDLIETIQHWPDPPRWHSMPLRVAGSDDYPASTPPVLRMSSSVLAVISFHRCEEWLHACLTSIARQTRPPENIVVVDDCSPALPLKLIEPFPNVTLLSTTRNAGPERILNSIIHRTGYDAYMVQDADDWSSHDRLELSLRAAGQTGAGLVGTHEFCIDHSKNALELCVYPPDVNRAMSRWTGHPLLHATSLISRALAMKVGGLDEQLNLIADVDFIARACHAGRIVNLPAFCFFRRVRAGSRTTHADTGYESPARVIEQRFMTIRASRNRELARAGREPNIFVNQKEPVGFIHHHGPKLRMAGT